MSRTPERGQLSALLLVALVACGGGPHDVTVRVGVSVAQCIGNRATTVQVFDESGTVIAKAHVPAANMGAEPPCMSSTTIDDVPRAKFYRFVVEDVEGGETTFSYDEMVAHDWRVSV